MGFLAILGLLALLGILIMNAFYIGVYSSGIVLIESLIEQYPTIGAIVDQEELKKSAQGKILKHIISLLVIVVVLIVLVAYYAPR